MNTESDSKSKLLKPTDTGEEQLTEKKVHDELHLKPALKLIFSLSVWQILGMLLHPMYHIVNSILMGHLGENYLAGLGLGALTLGICFLSLCVSFNGSLDTLGSQAYGSGDLKMCAIYLNRQLFLVTFVVCIGLIPLLFSY